MKPWIILLVAALSNASPSYRIPIREILPPPPWSSHQRDAEAEVVNALMFQRGAVESPPILYDGPPSAVTHEEYGSQRYPLRDAVEALPSNVADINTSKQPLRDLRDRDERVPLRDAVEHREAPFLGGVDHESIWIEPLAPPTLRRTQQTNDPKVVCHLNSQAVHRSEPFSLLPQAVPVNKCTHLVYDSATLDPHEYVVASRDPEYDEIKGIESYQYTSTDRTERPISGFPISKVITFLSGYKAATGLRSRDPSLKVLISIAAPTRGRQFLQVTRNCAAHCPKFTRSLLEFLGRHDFDGVEIDWATSSEYRNELKLLLRAISKPLNDKGYILAVAQRPEDPVDPEIVTIVDLIILRAWRDSHRYRKTEVALHPAPLGFVVRTVNMWIDRVPATHRSKIILGLPIFGQGYTLEFGNFTDSGAPVVGPGIHGPYTEKSDGSLAYYEVCEKLEEGLWISGRDEEGPYVKLGDQWIGYEDPVSVKIKTAYARSTGIGGVSLWSLDLDDFQGICGNPWPMLDAAAKAIGYYNEDADKKCSSVGLYSDPDNCSGFYSCFKGVLHHGHCDLGKFFNPTNGRCVKATPDLCQPGQANQIPNQEDLQTDVRETQQSERLEVPAEKGPRVVCYVTSWALYRKDDGKFVPENSDARLCTDVVYAFAGLNPDTLLIQPFDPWADIENNLYERITTVKGPRVLLALGGWTDSSGDKYSRLISNGASRRKFVAATINFLRKHNFDGLSLEWNYPKCWQSDCRKGPDSDKPNFTKLVQELRNEFDRQEPKFALAVAVSGYKEVIDRAYDIREISRAVNFMSVMAYDYHGAWESKSGHLAPLFTIPGDNNPYYNANFTMEYLVGLGAEKSKLLLGIPMYGQAYRLSNANQNDLGDPTTGPGTPGEFTRQPGMLAYYEICDRINNQGWKSGAGPSAHWKDQWVGYDDMESVSAKAHYILKNGYGGASMWTVDLDDFLNRCCVESFPLLKTVNRALGRIKTPTPGRGDCRRPPEPITPQAPTLTTHSDAAEGTPRPTTPMSTIRTTKITKWPTWTQKPTMTTMQTTRTTWPSWTWTSKSTKIPEKTTTVNPEQTTKTSTTFSWTQKPTYETSTPSIWTTTKIPEGPSCTLGAYLADPSNCGNYFRCVLGELRREQCAPGLHWDAKRGICDWPSMAKCQAETDTTTTRRPYWTTTRRTTSYTTQKPTPTFGWSTSRLTTERPTRVTTTKPIIITKPTERPERSCDHGQYYAYPDSCTNFLVCVNGNLVSQQCGPGLNWNKEKSMCDWAFKNPCVEKPMKNALLVSKDTPKNCIPGTYTGVPGDCKSYQACLWGRQEVFQCAPGLHFSKQTHICDWPSRANCQDDDTSTEEEIEVPHPTSHRPPRPVHKPTTTTEKVPWTHSTTKPATQATTPLPSAEISPDKVSPLSGHYKVVCYFTNWAWYRRGIGRYLPEHIDHTLCTHIVYGFAVLDYSELTIRAHDSWADYDNRFYERVVAYKKRGLKVLLALGGWNDSAGDKYSRLVNSPSARKKFIEHAIQFIEKYGFDGLDLDWEYPVCWQVDCKKGPASDKQGFADLLRELNYKLKPKNLLLTAAVSPSKKVIDHGYDVPALAKYLDWIAVMTYDFHGQWDKKTGHVAPLYSHPEDDFYYFNANYSINYWIAKGAPSRNIVMGMPLYGQSFSINDPASGIGLNSPASAGQSGEFTKAAGFLSYYEICDRINNRGWTVVQDPKHRMGPYAYKGSQWVSFDDAEMIRRKAQFVKDMNLGGGMVWALDLDDFRGRCGEGPHPLMHSLQKVLASSPSENDIPLKPSVSDVDLEEEPPKEVHIPSTTMPIQPTTAVDRVKEHEDSEYKVICYFTNWAWYRQGGGKFVPEDVDTDLCTHVLYGFAVLDGSQLTIKSHDPWADIDNKFYERIAALKSKGIKVLMAIGGWNDSAGDKYSRLVNSPSARRRFIENVLKFLEKYEFQGLDLDWEYPVCWQVDCKKGPASDKKGFSQFVKELSDEFKPRGLLLSAAVSPSKRVIDAGYDVPTLAKYFDWISVMTYDYHGQWDKKTGHVAPLYHLPSDWEPTFNANFSIHYWMEMGAPAKKLVMGAPMYGQSFSLAERSESGLNAPIYGGGEAGEATRARGFLAYYEICERTLQHGWTVVQDSERRIGPYAYKGDQWVSFDDAKQIKLKAELIKDLGLGGGMVWALDLDDFKNRCGCEPSPLLRTMNRVLRNYPAGPLCPVKKQVTMIDVGGSPPTSTTTQESNHEPTTSQRPTYLPPTVTTTTSSEIDIVDTVEIEAGPASPVGDCNGRLFIPHKEDCTKYFLCNFGKLSEHSCPSGLYWNENRCDWPENTKCKNVNRQTSESLQLIRDEESKEKKVICYFTKWASSRPGVGQFLPEDIDPKLCTHVVYGLATLDSERLTIQESPRDGDFLNRISSIRSGTGLKVLLGLGGWEESKDDKYSRLSHSPTERKKFARHASEYIEKHGFDGLDFIWEYPVCWQVDCSRGPPSDKEAFALLLKELSTAFKPKDLLLSASVSPSKEVIDEGYYVPSLVKYLDWINVMSYDYHGYWEGKTGHVAPLYDYPEIRGSNLNVNYSIRYWIQRGVPSEKIVMGIPTYGQSFTLSKVYKEGDTPGFNVETTAPGSPGEFTRSASLLSFYEICEKVKDDGWSVTKDPLGRVGPYASKSDQWVSYDDVLNIKKKAELIRDLKLGGGMIWSVDLDDFKNHCGCGRYPLLTALNYALKEKEYRSTDCT